MFYVQAYTTYDDIISSIMVNKIEVLQMSARVIEPSYSNENLKYAILHLQANDEVSFHIISGNFSYGEFVGWLVTDVE